MTNDHYQAFPKDKVVESFLKVIETVNQHLDAVTDEVTIFLHTEKLKHFNRMSIESWLKLMMLRWKKLKAKNMLKRILELIQLFQSSEDTIGVACQKAEPILEEIFPQILIHKILLVKTVFDFYYFSSHIYRFY